VATIVTRAGKGAALTHQEVDANFTGLNTELGQKEVASNKGVANGYASLDAAGKVPSAQLPSYVDDVVEVANFASLPGTGETGKIYVTIDTNKTYRWTGSTYIEISASPGSTDSLAEGSTNLYFTQARARASVSASGSLSYNSTTGVFSFSDAVTSVAGRTGAVTLTSSDVGLANVENKSSATIRGEITSGNVTTALGFTPLNRATVTGDWNVKTNGQASLISGGTNNHNGTTTTSGIYLPHSTAGYGVQIGGRLNTLWFRTEENNVWDSWRVLLHSGNYNSYSPTLTGTGASGTWGISITGSSASTTGNAATATALQTARAINGVSFNGTADITVADSTKLPLAGGTMTGAITFAAGQTWPTFNQNTTGSAATLTTGRTIGMTGDVTWTSGSFNGSANVTGTATLANSGVTAGTYTKVTVDAKGRVTSATTLAAGDVPTLNQNTTGSAATLTTARTINGTSFNGSANITTANWGTARTLTIGSTGKSVDGSANVSWSLAEIGALASGAKAADADLLDGYNSTAFSGPVSTIKQFFWNDLAASGTQARTFEIARLGIDYNDWNGGSGPFEVELYEGYYSRGLKKRYVIHWGYTNTYGIQLVEYSGNGDNNFQCRVGAPVLVSGDNYYLPVFVDVKYYAYCDVRVTTNRDITASNPPAIGTTFINASPSATNISDFTADSTVNFASTTAVQISGSQLLHAGNFSSYALPLTGGSITGNITLTQGTDRLISIGSSTNWSYTLKSEGDQFRLYDGNGTNFLYGVYNGGGTGKYLQLLGSNFVVNNNGTVTASGNQILHAGNVGSYALPIGGGTITGSRPIQIDTGGGFIAMTANAGGWSMGTYYKGSAGTTRAGFGALGSADSLTWAWIGTGYENPWMTLNGSAVNSLVALQQSGNQVLHAANYSSYALPLSGGTITGTVSINGGGSQPLNLTTSSSSPWGFGLTRSDAGVSSKIFLHNGSGSWAWVYEHNPVFYNGGAYNSFLHSGNYNSYSPSLTGSGASGTWAINITGSAGSASLATDADRLRTYDHRIKAPNSDAAGRAVFGFTSWANNNTAPWADYLHLRSYTDGSGGADNLVTFRKDAIGMRIWQQSFGSGSAYSSYVDVLHSSNYSSYALPLSGGTLTGSATLSGNGIGLYFTGGNNRIYFGGSYRAMEGNANGTQLQIGEGYSATYLQSANIYATTSNHVVLHAGNYSSYALPLSGGNMTGNISGPAYNTPSFIRFASDSNWAYGCSYDGGSQYWMQVQFYGTGDDTRGFRVLNTNGNSVAFRVNGAGNAIAAGNVTAYSDERVKANWRKLDDGFLVNLANVKSGIYDRTDVEITQAGVSAQSLREVLPESVIEAENGDLSVAYGNAAMVSAIELAKKVVALENKVAELQARIH
jgi:hypothetical protein